jgi:hypothetical protein
MSNCRCLPPFAWKKMVEPSIGEARPPKAGSPPARDPDQRKGRLEATFAS